MCRVEEFDASGTMDRLPGFREDIDENDSGLSNDRLGDSLLQRRASAVARSSRCATTDGGTQAPSRRAYCLGVFLLALGRHGLLDYPLVVNRGESPDFIVTERSGEAVGLEVTRATEAWLQREMTSADREYRRRELTAEKSGIDAEPVLIALSQKGWVGEEAETQWCALVRRSIEGKVAKLSKFAPATRHDLLIYDDTPLPTVDRRKVLAFLDPWAADLKSRAPMLGRISIVISVDVLFDVGGKSRILPYVHWSAPDLDETPDVRSFSERVDLAGRVQVERTIREPSEDQTSAFKTDTPAYYVDRDGRIIKRTPEGRRFEVRVKDNGGEIVVRELRSE